MELIEQSTTNPGQLSNIVQYWQEQIKHQQESGLSKAAYCRQQDISCRKFGYWSRKLTPNHQSGSQFIPVKLNLNTMSHFSQQPARTLCSLELNNGHQLKVYDQEVLPLLISLLSQ